MFFRVENLGPLREAEVDLSKRLIVLTGPNNTGKTYLAWSVYGLHRFWSDRRKYVALLDGWAEELTAPPHELDVEELFARDAPGILADMAAAYSPALHRCFAAESDRFKDASLSFRTSDVTPMASLKDFSSVTHLNGIAPAVALFNLADEPPRLKLVLFEPQGETHRDSTLMRTIGLWKRRNGAGATNETSAAIAKLSEGDRTLLKSLLAALLFGIVTRSLLPSCVLLPAERIAVNIFAKELALKRTELVDKLIDADLEGEGDAPLDLVRRSAGRYPWPIRDSLRTANDLANLRKEVSPFADLADELEDAVMGGKVGVSEDGEMFFTPEGAPERRLAMHLTASVVKSLSSLVFYFRHVAMTAEFLIIDEPELNLHPDNQRKIARILAKAVNRGFKIMMSTHSDYIVRELDHLIMLSKLSPEEAKELEYDPAWALRPEEVGVYLFDHKRATSVPVEETGFSVETIDAEINRMQATSQRFYAKLSR